MQPQTWFLTEIMMKLQQVDSLNLHLIITILLISKLPIELCVQIFWPFLIFELVFFKAHATVWEIKQKSDIKSIFLFRILKQGIKYAWKNILMMSNMVIRINSFWELHFDNIKNWDIEKKCHRSYGLALLLEISSSKPILIQIKKNHITDINDSWLIAVSLEHTHVYVYLCSGL